MTLLVLLLHDCLSTTSFQRNRLGFDSLVMGSLLIQMESTSRRIFPVQSHVSSLMAYWESVQCCLCCQCWLSVQSCTYTHPLARSINKWEKNAFSVWQRFDKWLENVKPDETARAIICFFLPSISSVNKRRGRLWCFHRALPDISSNSSWHTRSVSEFRGFARIIKRSNTFRNQLTWKILFRTTWAENAGSCWKSNPIPWLVSPPTPCFNTQYSIEMSSKPKYRGESICNFLSCVSL